MTHDPTHRPDDGHAVPHDHPASRDPGTPHDPGAPHDHPAPDHDHAPSHDHDRAPARATGDDHGAPPSHDAPPAPGAARPIRDPETRRRDHEQIDRLADGVLPDLISRLATSGLGEIEVREDDWRIRLRRPAPHRGGPADRPDRGHERAGDRATRAGAAAGPTADPRTPRDGRDAGPVHGPGAETNTADPGAADAASSPATSPNHVMATSPAVGVFQPRSQGRPGSRVRAGDRIAAVDLLGVPQDVVAPVDGVIVSTLVEAGEGVEYGQDLVVIETVRAHPDAAGAATLVGES